MSPKRWIQTQVCIIYSSIRKDEYFFRDHCVKDRNWYCFWIILLLSKHFYHSFLGGNLGNQWSFNQFPFWISMVEDIEFQRNNHQKIRKIDTALALLITTNMIWSEGRINICRLGYLNDIPPINYLRFVREWSLFL